MEAARLMHITKVKQPRREADTINANGQTSKDRQRGRQVEIKREMQTRTLSNKQKMRSK